MELYFIRHAQSTNNRLYEETGRDVGRSEDPELTDLGFRQADCLAEYLVSAHPRGGSGRNGSGGFGLTHLYTSLMVRAVITASAASKAIGVELHGWTCLHECGGIYLENEQGERVGQPGKSRPYFSERFPGLRLPDEKMEKGWWNKPYEDEPTRRLRARTFLDDLKKRHGGSRDRVAVFSHGGFYNEVMRELLGCTNCERTWFAINNTGITRVDFGERETVVIYQNRLDHLTPDMIS